MIDDVKSEALAALRAARVYIASIKPYILQGETTRYQLAGILKQIDNLYVDLSCVSPPTELEREYDAYYTKREAANLSPLTYDTWLVRRNKEML